jgi:predicted dienelactone hydrolase
MRGLLLLLGAFFFGMNTNGSPTDSTETRNAGVSEAQLQFHFSKAGPARTVVTDIWFPSPGKSEPQKPLASGRYPVLLFFPGWGAKVSINASLLRGLASHGFVVAGVSYPKGPGLPDPAVPMKFAPDEAYASGTAQGNAMVRIEAEDASLVLDKLAALNESDSDKRFTHLIDTSHAGVLGYSLGGSVAAQAAFKDPRFKAVMNLDGWMFGDVATAFFTQPYLVISDDLAPATPEQMASPDVFMRNFSGLRDRDKKHQTAQLEASHGFRVTISGASHFTFSDEAKANENNAGPIDPKRALTIVEAYAADFFGKYLASRPAPLLDVPEPRFPETKFEAFPAKS